MSENTTTNDMMTDAEILEICEEMGGLIGTFSLNGSSTKYRLMDYDITVSRYSSKVTRWKISIDGHILDRGDGNVIDAARAIIMAEG